MPHGNVYDHRRKAGAWRVWLRVTDGIPDNAVFLFLLHNVGVGSRLNAGVLST